MGSHLRRKAWVARGAEETAGGATVLLPRGAEFLVRGKKKFGVKFGLKKRGTTWFLPRSET